MATKTVALDEEAYAVLKRAKKPGESFSDVVKRVVVPRRPLSDFVGIWKDMPAADFRAFEKWRADARRADVNLQRRLLKNSRWPHGCAPFPPLRGRDSRPTRGHGHGARPHAAHAGRGILARPGPCGGNVVTLKAAP